MKITIDTAADKKEDIKKAIRLLQSLLEEEVSGVSQECPEDAAGMMSMFGSGPAYQEDRTVPDSALPAGGGEESPAEKKPVSEDKITVYDI